MYKASGDNHLPHFNHRLLNNLHGLGVQMDQLSSNNILSYVALSPMRLLFLCASRCIVGFMVYRGGFFISAYPNVDAPVSWNAKHTIIDLSEVDDDDLFSTVTCKINGMILENISNRAGCA